MIPVEAVEAAADQTLTPETLLWLQQLARDAERDLALLPEGSQPFWFRTRMRK